MTKSSDARAEKRFSKRISPFVGDCPRTVFKYVDEADAHYLEAGCVKIGTLRSYGKLESSRRDDREAIVERPIDVVHTGMKGGRDYLEASGVFRGGGRISVSNLTIQTSHPDCSCFCAANAPDIADLEEGRPQAVFEIRDILLWARRVERQNRQLGEFRIGEVVYGSRVSMLYSNPLARPDPFLKPSNFALEREARVLWRPKATEPLEVIFGEPDRVLAGMMRRIR